MARIVLGSYLVSYPVGGFLSWTLQWLVGFHRLGHEVYLVEKSGHWPLACFNMATRTMGDDCSGGLATVTALLDQFGLAHRLCFVDGTGSYHGMTRREVEALFRSADLFVDISAGPTLNLRDTWLAEAAASGVRVYVDGEPGYAQILMQQRETAGEELPTYDHYFSVGRNLGSNRCTAPTAGIQWNPTFDPVNVDLFPVIPPSPDAPFTTVMAWQSHKRIHHNGVTYGQKDMEFGKFSGLPRRVSRPMEIAVGGRDVPVSQLEADGWRVRESHSATSSFEAFRSYIQSSRGEFTVCKHVFVSTWSGWFSDRSAAYLASGRPVVMQDTGFSEHLPVGQGLFAVRSMEEAVDALARIDGDYKAHSRWARALAVEHLDARVVLTGMLRKIGMV